MALLEECKELATGTLRTEIEIRKDGKIHLLCPCCEGSGEHDTLPGNNPARDVYRCQTCQGEGHIDQAFQESQQNLTEPNPDWQGAEINQSVLVAPWGNRTWRLGIECGPDGCALGRCETATVTTRELLRFAHQVILNLEDPGHLDQYEWTRQHRRLNPRTSLQKTILAWKSQQNAKNPAGAGVADHWENIQPKPPEDEQT